MRISVINAGIHSKAHSFTRFAGIVATNSWRIWPFHNNRICHKNIPNSLGLVHLAKNGKGPNRVRCPQMHALYWAGAENELPMGFGPREWAMELFEANYVDANPTHGLNDHNFLYWLLVFKSIRWKKCL
jgi:hypothetical protein